MYTGIDVARQTLRRKRARPGQIRRQAEAAAVKETADASDRDSQSKRRHEKIGGDQKRNLPAARVNPRRDKAGNHTAQQHQSGNADLPVVLHG